MQGVLSQGVYFSAQPQFGGWLGKKRASKAEQTRKREGEYMQRRAEFVKELESKGNGGLLKKIGGFFAIRGIRKNRVGSVAKDVGADLIPVAGDVYIWQQHLSSIRKAVSLGLGRVVLLPMTMLFGADVAMDVAVISTSPAPPVALVATVVDTVPLVVANRIILEESVRHKVKQDQKKTKERLPNPGES